MQSQPKARPQATDSSPVPIGIDDGYAVTKLALADGRLLAIPSAARAGRSNVSWMPRAEQLIFEYETKGTVFSVGDVDASSTRFEGYSSSALNRVIVQHALQCADLEGRELAAVSGLPVNHFYHRSGKRRAAAIADKQANLAAPVTPRSAASAAEIIDHDVVPEALAAWYDHVITVNDGRASLDQERICRPLAVVDIGGRTTDTVVVANQGIEHSSSASVTLGCLDVQRSLANSLEERFELAAVSGLPVNHFYHRSGKRRATAISEKQANLVTPVTPLSAASAAEIIAHDVVPEALAAWYDHVITVNDGRASLDQERICRPLAVVDIGGRTTDTVVVANQGIEHSSSASVTLGCLDVQRSLANSLEERFELGSLGHRQLRGVLETGRIRLYGRDYDVSAEIDAARAEFSARLHTEIKRQLGRGAELERIVMVGGGALALRKLIADWFPNQVTAPQPAFANARGMLKYRRFVLSDDAAERV